MAELNCGEKELEERKIQRLTAGRKSAGLEECKVVTRLERFGKSRKEFAGGEGP
jgi:hypothetical protein